MKVNWETTTPAAAAAASAASAHNIVSHVGELMSYGMDTVITRLGRVVEASVLHANTGVARGEAKVNGQCSGHAAACEGSCTELCTCLNVKPPELSRKVPLVDWPGPQKPVCGVQERTVHTSPQCSTGRDHGDGVALR